MKTFSKIYLIVHAGTMCSYVGGLYGLLIFIIFYKNYENGSSNFIIALKISIMVGFPSVTIKYNSFTLI